MHQPPTEDEDDEARQSCWKRRQEGDRAEPMQDQPQDERHDEERRREHQDAGRIRHFVRAQGSVLWVEHYLDIKGVLCSAVDCDRS